MCPSWEETECPQPSLAMSTKEGEEKPATPPSAPGRPHGKRVCRWCSSMLTGETYKPDTAAAPPQLQKPHGLCQAMLEQHSPPDA